MHHVASVQNLSKIYQKRARPLRSRRFGRSISTSFTGEFTAIMGAAARGEHPDEHPGMPRPPDKRRLLPGDQDVSRLSDNELSEIRSRRIGSSSRTSPDQQLTVLENLGSADFYLGIAPHVRRARAMELAERVGLAERVHHRPTELSGGSSSASVSPGHWSMSRSS